MRTKLNIIFPFIFLFIVPVDSCFSQDNTNATKEDFLKLSSYLSAGSGVWVSQNAAYDSTQKASPKAFSLNFHWNDENQILHMKLIVHYQTLDYESFESIWAWHPGKKTIMYLSNGPDGRWIEGETVLQNKKLFTTTAMFYQPDGSSVEIKDENFIISENEHKNISYQKNTGEWKETGVYHWERTS